MARIKRSVWIGVFNSAVASAKRLIKHPAQLRRLIEEAAIKTQKHSAAIREIVPDLQLILRMVKAWLSGNYKDISLKSIVILIGAILYFLNPFNTKWVLLVTVRKNIPHQIFEDIFFYQRSYSFSYFYDIGIFREMLQGIKIGVQFIIEATF